MFVLFEFQRYYELPVSINQLLSAVKVVTSVTGSGLGTSLSILLTIYIPSEIFLFYFSIFFF